MTAPRPAACVRNCIGYTRQACQLAQRGRNREYSILIRQGLQRRIPDTHTLVRETAAVA